MTYTDQQARTATVGAGVGLIGVSLLIAGSSLGHMALLAWGLVACGISLAAVSVAVLQGVFDAAVRRSVETTAVLVGEAIAEVLRDEHLDAEPAGEPCVKVVKLYSR